MALLCVKDLCTRFHTRQGVVRAVEGVSLTVEKGVTVGIVGESGSGKSVLCYSLMGLLPCPPARIERGSAIFGGVDLLACSAEERRRIRGRRIAMIFQDPMTSLNPYMRIGRQLLEPLALHERIDKKEAFARGIAALEEVGIPDPAALMRRHPHEFSGGMRQRVMIAMALIARPELLIADEPTTALDVTVQAQILELLRGIQQRHGMSIILISHDLGVVSGMCDSANVMYAGRIVESAPTADLYHRPRHPYTVALERSTPRAESRGGELDSIAGMPPDLSKEITGCPFAPRCAHARPRCFQAAVELRDVALGHLTACVRAQDGEVLRHDGVSGGGAS